MLKNKTKLFLLFSLVLITLVGVSAVSAVDVNDNTTSTLEEAPSYTADSQANINTADDNNKNLEQDDVTTVTSTKTDTAKEATAVSTKTVEKTNTKQLKTVESDTGIDLTLSSTTLNPGDSLTVNAEVIEGYDEGELTVFLAEDIETPAETYETSSIEGTTGSVTLSIPSSITSGSYVVYATVGTLFDEDLDELQSDTYTVTITDSTTSTSPVTVSFESPVGAGETLTVTVSTTDEDYENCDFTVFIGNDDDYNLEHADGTLEGLSGEINLVIPSDYSGTYYIRASVEKIDDDDISYADSDVYTLTVTNNEEEEETDGYVNATFDSPVTPGSSVTVTATVSEELIGCPINFELFYPETEIEDGYTQADYSSYSEYPNFTINDTVMTYTFTLPEDKTGTYHINVYVDAYETSLFDEFQSGYKELVVQEASDNIETYLSLDSAEEITQSEGIEVYGQLTIADTDEGIANQDITITISYDNDEVETYTATTDSEGNYQENYTASYTGIATISAEYLGNGSYASSQADEDIIVTISEDEEEETTLETLYIDFVQDETYYDDQDIIVNGLLVDDEEATVDVSDITVTVTVTYSDDSTQTGSTTTSSGEFSVTIPAKDTLGAASIFIETTANSQYNSTSETYATEIISHPEANITASAENVTYPDDIVVNGSVTSNIDDVITVLNGSNLNITVTNSKGDSRSYNTTVGADGTYTYNIEVTEDDIGEVTIDVLLDDVEYKTTNKTITVTVTEVEKLTPDIQVEVDEEYAVDETLYINGPIADPDTDEGIAGLAVNITFLYDGDESASVIESTTNEDGELDYEYTVADGKKVGNLTITITTASTDTYESVSASYNVTITEAEAKETEITLEVDSTTDGDIYVDGVINYTDADGNSQYLPAGETVNVQVTFADETTSDVIAVPVDSEGRFTTTVAAGTHYGQATVTATYVETDNYLGSEESASITVLIPTILTIETDDGTVSTGFNVTGTLVAVTDDDTIELSDVTVSINATTESGDSTVYNATVTDGEFTITIPASSTGVVTVVATFDETDTYAASSDNATANINEDLKETSINFELDDTTSGNITVDAEIVYIDGDDEIALPSGEVVSISAVFADESTYTTTATVSEGSIEAVIPTDGKRGLVTVTITYEESENYAGTSASDETTLINPTSLMISADESTIDDGLTVTGYLSYTDADGNTQDLASQTVTVRVTYADEQVDEFDVTTDENGTFVETRTALATGSVEILAFFEESGEYAASNDTITTTITEDNSVETIITFELDTSTTGDIEVDADIDYLDDDEQEVALPNAEVTIIAEFADGTLSDVINTTSDSEGNIIATIPTNGKYGTATVNITYAGVEDQYKASNATSTTNVVQQTWITVEADNNTQQSEGIFITGTVSYGEDYTDMPDGTVTITVTYEDDSTETFTATIEDGQYQVNHTANQTGLVTIDVDFMETEIYAASTNNTTANIIEDEKSLIETFIALDESTTSVGNITVDGILETVDETPIEGATVNVIISSESGLVMNETNATTDSEGRFIATIPTDYIGFVNIVARFDQTDVYEASEATTNTTLLTRTRLTVDADEEVAVDEELTISGTLSTYVDDDPIASATIEITVTYADNTTVELNATTGEDGSFTVTTTPSSVGITNITAFFEETDAYGEAEADTNTTITEALKETFIELELDDSTTDNIEIDGNVQYKDEDDWVNIPSGSVNILVTFADGTTDQTTATVTDGNFVATIASNGKYGEATFEVTFDATDIYKASNATDTINVIRTTIVSVTADESTKDEGLTISGTLVYDDGEEHNIENATLNVVVTYEDDTTDEFTVEVVDGEYIITREALSTGVVTIEVEFEETDDYAASEANTTTNITEKIIIEPEINYEADSPITSGEPIEINAEFGYYDDDDNFIGIADATINYEVTFEDGTVITGTITTESDGTFIYNVDTTGKTGTATVKLTFDATDDYAAASATAEVEIEAATTVETSIALDDVDEVYYNGREATLTGNLTYKDGDEDKAFASQDVTVTVTYEDEDGITETYTATTDAEGKFTVTITPNGLGIANITASYAGNETEDLTYLESSQDYPVEIQEVEYDVSLDEIDEPDYPLNTQVNITGQVTTNLPELDVTEVTITVNDEQTYTVPVDSEGKFTFVFNGTDAGDYTITAEANDDSDYVIISIDTEDSNITASANTTRAHVGEEITVNGTLIDAVSGVGLAGQTVNITVNGTQYTTTTDSEGKYTYTLSADSEGNYTIEVSYDGNDNYIESSIDEALTVEVIKRLNLTLIIINTNNNVKVGETVEITVLLVDENDKLVKVDTLKYLYNDIDEDVQVNDTITNLPVYSDVNGTVTITLVHEMDDLYNEASNTTTITFNNLETQIVANDDSVQTGKINDTITLSVDVIDENGNAVTQGTVRFYDGNEVLGTADVTEGKATITTNFTTAGTHNITVTYTSTENYNEADNDYTVKAIIEKLDATVTVTTPSSIKVGETKNITVNATGYPNGIVTVTVDNETYTATTDANGIATIPYTATEAGEAKVTVTIPESDYVNSQTVTDTLTISKGTVTLTVSPTTRTVTYPTNGTYTITLKDSQGNAVAGEYIIVDGVIVGQTNANGQVTANVSKDVGNYTIKVEYPGSDDYNTASKTVKLNVAKSSVTVKVTSITGKVDEKLEVTATLSRNVTGGIVTFTDKDSNVLATANVYEGVATAIVSFNKTYSGNIIATFSNNSNYNNANGTGKATITALSTVVTVDPVANATAGQATTITGKVTDENGNPLAGVKVNVTAGNKTSTVTTDANGTYKTSYTPANASDNTITVSVPATSSTSAKNVTQTITIAKKSSKLTLSNLSSVNVGNNIKINGTLTDSSNKAIANATVTVTLDGTSKNVTTNAKGVYSTTIKSTVAGKSVVTASYDGNSIYEASSAVVKTVTVNKLSTKTTVTSTSGKVNDNLTVKATVKSGSANVTDGLVIFTDKTGKQLGIANVTKGVASVTFSYNTTYSGNVFAYYLGAANYTASNNKTSVKVVKLNTVVTVGKITGKVNDVINLTAKVVDEKGNNVTGGYVLFRLNGQTLKYANGSTITANVYDGVATAQVTTNSTWMNKANSTKYINAKYNGNSIYNTSESSNVNINLTNRTAQVTITSDRIIAHGGDNISITAVVTDEGNLVKTGQVFFKIAGETLKDKNNKTILIDVVNGQATLNYSIEIGASAKSNMTVEAIFVDSIYDRAENTSQLSVLKADVYFNTTIAYAKNGKAALNVTLRDAFGNLCKLNTTVALKVDGATFSHVTAVEGVVTDTLDVSKLKAGVHTIEYVAGANNRYNSARYTNALVIE